jgi:protein-S-isoprenylcysteine O-methyltransferase Ste14
MRQRDIKTRIRLRLVLAVFFLMAILFLPAGTLNWPEAWIFIAVYLLFGILISNWLLINDPQLLEKRMSREKPKKRWDKLIVSGIVVVTFPLFIVPGFDAVRYQWSKVNVLIEAIGFAGFALSFYIVFLTMKENTYLSKIVEVQVDRGHEVVTTGPYQYVRHPMYFGLIILFFSMPLALGSLYGLVPGLILTILIALRTHFEDKTLHEELPGYREYAEATRYRLLPGLW